jgi:hypothetical protein
MGLDVSHIQLIFQPDAKGNFFYIDDWDLDCNVPLKNYSKYIRTIDDLDFNKTLAIVNNEEQFEMLKKTEWFNGLDYLNVFVGELNDNMREQISRFVENQKLTKLETSELSCEHDGIKYHTISFGEPIKVKGIYYMDDIGYQSRGMNTLFYETFKKYMLWGQKEDFELAYTCVGDEWYLEILGEKEVEEMRLNFKENFVDKFEFGKSLLNVSF